MNWYDYSQNAAIFNEAQIYTTPTPEPTPLKQTKGRMLTLSVWYDSTGESETKNGYTKGDDYNYNVFRVGRLFVCWGENK